MSPFYSRAIFSILIVKMSWVHSLALAASKDSSTLSRDILSSMSSVAQGVHIPVTKFKLENGLTVLLPEDHSVPLISYHTWYKVGSRNEKEGLTGAAHMLEHMMFKGSSKYSGEDFEKILHKNGIENNAFTTQDYTGFYESLPADKLEVIMDIEVDRMASLAIKESDLKSEREVVKEERRWRLDNNPMGLIHSVMMSSVFSVSPYKWPVIGFMNDITQYTSEKLRYFYDSYYGPNNAILVLVGDFQTDVVRKMITRSYEKLVGKPVPDENSSVEPEQKIQKNYVVKKNVENETLIVAYQGPKVGQADAYVLDLAANILGSGNSSWLHKKFVVNNQKATSAFAYNWSLKTQGVFSVGLSLKPGQDSKAALYELYHEIWKLRFKKITEGELQKAKTIVLKDLVEGLTTMDGKARGLAVNEIMTGNYENLWLDLDKYENVSADQIQNAAKKYLDQFQRNIIVLKPAGRKSGEE